MAGNLLLPDTDRLVRDVCDSLNKVARAGNRLDKNPANQICTALKERLDRYQEGIESAFGRGGAKHEDERECLYDFSGVVCQPKDKNSERYTVQLVVAGEIEWTENLSKDFEKLMFADALVYFFAFPDWLREHRPVSDMDFYSSVAESRVNHMSVRGIIPTPVFVIGAYSGENREFTTRVIRHETD